MLNRKISSSKRKAKDSRIKVSHTNDNSKHSTAPRTLDSATALRSFSSPPLLPVLLNSEFSWQAQIEKKK